MRKERILGKQLTYATPKVVQITGPQMLDISFCIQAVDNAYKFKMISISYKEGEEVKSKLLEFEEVEALPLPTALLTLLENKILI